MESDSLSQVKGKENNKQISNYSENQYHTIIIGSGIAGMNAAYYLSNQGFKVLVLQAQNYIGGRLKTINAQLLSGKTFAFDYGASWIHGSCKKHPITKLAKKIQGVQMVETIDDQITVYNLKAQDVTKIVDKEYEIMQQILQKCEKRKGPSSIQQEIERINSQKLKNQYFMFNISYDPEFQSSGSIDKVSAQGYAADEQFKGKQMLILSGYQKFSQYLALTAKVQTLLNHKVNLVQHDGQNWSIIKCSNGSIFKSERVIFAVPIGALKAQTIKCQPQFPQWKKQAINELMFGNVCKILIDFDKPITNEKDHYFGVVQKNINKRGLATFYMNLQSLAGIPALMTFGLGPNADQAEMMSENELKSIITERVNIFSDRQITPNDFKIMRSSWKSNSNFGGTYTYHGVDSKDKHWENIAKPLFNQKWYFCGEHTSFQYRGTVHGAYLSGQKAAKAIIKNLGKGEWSYFGKKGRQRKSSSSSNQ